MTRAPLLLSTLLLLACGDKSDGDTSTDGSDGSDGSDGADGSDGTDGSDGSDGTDGTAAADGDGDGVLAEDDCDDSDPDVGAPEAAWADRDGDGYGDPAAPVETCDWVDAADNSDDCDDTSAAALPGGVEACDSLDNDCNGAVDDGAWLSVPGDFATLAEAIDGAESGSTVCVAAGTHEGFTADGVSLTLIGAGGSAGTFLDGGGVRRSADINGGAFTLEGFTLEGGAVADGYRGSAYFANGGVQTLRDIVVASPEPGIGYVQGFISQTNGVVDFEDVTIAGVTVELADTLEGVLSFSNTRGTIRGLTIRDNLLRADSIAYSGIVALSSDLVVEDFDLIGNVVEASRTDCGLVNVQQGYGTLELVRARSLDNASLGTLGSGTDVCSSYYAEVHVENLLVANTTTDEYSGRGPLYVGGPEAHLTVENATVVGLDVVYGGLISYYGSGDNSATLRNIIVSDVHSDLGGVQYHYPGDVSDETVEYAMLHDVTADSGEDRGGTALGTRVETGVVEADPMFLDVSAAAAEDWDLRLSAGSPARDAGVPEQVDADGTRVDLGAYGGPNAW